MALVMFLLVVCVLFIVFSFAGIGIVGASCVRDAIRSNPNLARKLTPVIIVLIIIMIVAVN
jgi:hypothetical protein